MGRPRVIHSSEHPYHITARCINREWFDVPMDYVFGIYINLFKESIATFGVELHAFVLMQNHFHMVLSTPMDNVSEFLRLF